MIRNKYSKPVILVGFTVNFPPFWKVSSAKLLVFLYMTL